MGLERQSSWYEDNFDYYGSEQWARKRADVLERENYQCQASIEGFCTGRATQVHHLTYQHFRCEPLFDLVAVCADCHRAITFMDRNYKKGARHFHVETHEDGRTKIIACVHAPEPEPAGDPWEPGVRAADVPKQ